MIVSVSSFTASSVALPNNAVKSLVFLAAQVLVAWAVYKFASLLAAKLNQFTSLLMFSEDYIQRGWYLGTRGVSGSSILVLLFTVFYALAHLFGTLLWALDAPGYIMQSRNVSASEIGGAVLANPAYVVQLPVNGSNMTTIDDDLPRAFGVNLFDSSLNLTLTGEFARGDRQVTPATQPKAGGRIWLDEQGLSVSPDTMAMFVYETDKDGKITSPCRGYQYTGKIWGWNCTFNNSLASQLTDNLGGRPEVHWDDKTDAMDQSRYIRINRLDNVWASFGSGGGTAVMKQMFAVTKGTRRHTFLLSFFRCTLLTKPTVPFQPDEISDILKRTWSTNETEQHAPLLDKLFTSITAAQDQGRSFTYGINSVSNSNFSATQVGWEYLTSMVDDRALYSMLRITLTNITLVRSENITSAPAPFEPCEAYYMNEAYGGKVTGTDCIGSEVFPDARFFGQVDTSAVLILYGLGAGRTNASADALYQPVWEWYVGRAERMDALLLSRGLLVSVSPALVTVALSSVQEAVSHLQILLVALAALFAAAGWLALQLLAGPHWSNTLLANLVAQQRRRGPGYVKTPLEVQLHVNGKKGDIRIDGSMVMFEGNDTSTVYVQQWAPHKMQQQLH
jgi:hypothetical protein